MHAQAEWDELWVADEDTSGESTGDEFDDNDLLRAVLGRVREAGSRDSNLRELFPEGPKKRTRSPDHDDLIAQSERIRRECNDLVRRYEAALGAGKEPQREAPPPRMRQRSTPEDDSRGLAPQGANWRKKAILMLMIEELL